MSDDKAALVLVQPDDTVAMIEDKVRQTDARFVQLLVADHAPALQTADGFAALRQALNDDLHLMVISSDAQTLQSAQANQLDAIPVYGSQVSFAPPGMAASSDETQALVPLEGTQRPVSNEEVALLDALERMPLHDRYTDIDDPDAPLFGGPDMDDVEELRPVGYRDNIPDFADDWDIPDDDDWDDRPHNGRGRNATGAAAYDDIAVPAERLRRARRTEAGAPPTDWRQQVAPLAPTVRDATPRRARPASDDVLYDDDYDRPRRRSMLGALLPLVFLLAVAAAAALWFLNARTTVRVTPPSATAIERPFAKEVIPLAVANSNSNQSAAIQAEQVAATAATTVQGQASQEQVPVGVARGNVTIVNQLGQPIALPEGTEFVGKNESGQEVRFLIDAPGTVPPAVTTNSLTGTSTTFGQIEVAISARSPGSASNVPPNSITQIVLPGQAALQSGGGVTIVQQNPIQGGSEEQRYVVTQDDVQRVLGDALTKLYNQDSIAQLNKAVTQSGYLVDPSTVMPDAAALASPDAYQVTVEPQVGQPTEGNNPTFQVTVQAEFKALAVPNDQPIAEQLRTVAPRFLSERCPAGTTFSGTSIGSDNANAAPGWQWDGTALTVNGSFTCTPQAQEVRSRVLEAVLGTSAAAARANLAQLQAQGVIGDYDLPTNKTQLPNYNFLFNIEVLATPGSQSAPAPAQPTGAAQPTSATQPTGAAQP